MTHDNILKIADEGYRRAAHELGFLDLDGGCLCILEDGKPITGGDSLALHIITELCEGVDIEDDDIYTLYHARGCIQESISLLQGVVRNIDEEIGKCLAREK